VQHYAVRCADGAPLQVAARFTGGIDFLILNNGNHLVIGCYPALRDLSDFLCPGPTISRQCSDMEPAINAGSAHGVV
jgi:hypothetical protein